MMLLSMFAYIASFVCLGLGLGLFIQSNPRLFFMNRWAGVLAGLALTPYAIAACMLAGAFLWPGGPEIFFMAMPGGCGLILLWAHSKALVRMWSRCCRSAGRLGEPRSANCFQWALATNGFGAFRSAFKRRTARGVIALGHWLEGAPWLIPLLKISLILGFLGSLAAMAFLYWAKGPIHDYLSSCLVPLEYDGFASRLALRLRGLLYVTTQAQRMVYIEQLQRKLINSAAIGLELTGCLILASMVCGCAWKFLRGWAQREAGVLLPVGQLPRLDANSCIRAQAVIAVMEPLLRPWLFRVLLYLSAAGLIGFLAAGGLLMYFHMDILEHLQRALLSPGQDLLSRVFVRLLQGLDPAAPDQTRILYFYAAIRSMWRVVIFGVTASFTGMAVLVLGRAAWRGLVTWARTPSAPTLLDLPDANPASAPVRPRFPVSLDPTKLKSVLELELVMALALVMCLALFKLVASGMLPVTSYDALQYLSEASMFSESRTPHAVIDYHSTQDGSLRGDIHNASWPLFLSHALFFTDAPSPGYPDDVVARFAFMSTLPCMLAAVAALAMTMRCVPTAFLALLLLLLVPQYSFVLESTSRDAFRIIPLALFATMCIGLSAKRMRLRLRLPALFAPSLLGGLSIAGHTLGLFVVPTLGLSWFLWILPGRPRIRNVACVAGAVLLGCLVFGKQYLAAYVETGRIEGNEVYEEYGYRNTALEAEALRRDELRRQASLKKDKDDIFHRDFYRLSVPGGLATLAAILLWRRLAARRKTAMLPFLGLCSITALAPFTGAFDTASIKLTDWLLVNDRYPLHIYPFFAVCLAGMFMYAWRAAMARGNPQSLYNKAVVAYLLVAVVALVSAGTIYNWPVSSQYSCNAYLADTWDGLKRILAGLPENKRLLLDDQRFNYIISNKAMLMFSRPSWDILQAKTEEEAAQALEANNIAAVALLANKIKDWWDKTPLFWFLENSGKFELLRTRHLLIYFPRKNGHSRADAESALHP